MGLAHIIQNAWNKQAKWLVLLRPFSYLYGKAFDYNKKCYFSGKKDIYLAPIPVMVIGNITVGGSGKTPLLISLVKYLQMQKVKVGVISRGYGGQGPFPCLVKSTDFPEKVGDEPVLIAQATEVPMAVGPNRQESIELLLKNYTLDLIISDDGLQHWALARQIEWVVLDARRGLGNERLLPEGFLREPKIKLDNSTVIEHTIKPKTALNMYLQAGNPYLLHALPVAFKREQTFHAVVGIGYPERFYQTLQELGIKNYICHEFADHYAYTVQDLTFSDDLPIITTEKDAVKIKELSLSNPVWVVPVEAQLSPMCYEVLHTQLQPFNLLKALP